MQNVAYPHPDAPERRSPTGVVVANGEVSLRIVDLKSPYASEIRKMGDIEDAAARIAVKLATLAGYQQGRIVSSEKLDGHR